MKNLISKVFGFLLILMLIMILIPLHSNATESDPNVIMFEKADGNKYFYIEGFSSKDFKYAFSNSEEIPTEGFQTCTQDLTKENIAYLEKSKTYDYMFILTSEKSYIINLDSINSIKENEISDLEKLTKIISIDASQSEEKSKEENGTTVTTTTAKIVITEEGDFKYQLLKIDSENEAFNLYNLIQDSSKQEKMYDKLNNYIKIRDVYTKLLTDAKWEDANNNTIYEPSDSIKDDKYIVLVQKVNGADVEKSDIQIMTCDRVYDNGADKIEEINTVEKRTALPVTGENLALYIVFGILILAIIIMAVKIMKDSKSKGKHA